MPSSNFRTRTGCLTCRSRHLKCDEQQPICRRCSRGHWRCEYPPQTKGQKFRHDHNSAGSNSNRGKNGSQEFTAQHEWIPLPSHIEFVDETEQVAAEYSNETTPLVPSPPSLTPDFSCITSSVLPVFANLGNGPEAANARTALTIQQLVDDRTKDINTDQLIGSQTVSIGDPIPLSHSSPPLSTPSYAPTIVLDEPRAQLFRHYITKLAPWLDTTDCGEHFTREVPRKALSSPILLNACLAFAARNLARVSNYNPDAAEYFHSACIELIIPALSDQTSAAADPTLLAATVILRIYEQLNVNGDDERHLWGSTALVDLQPHHNAPTAGGIRQAAFWVFIRQDIYMAMVHQRPLRCNMDCFNVEVTFDAKDDATWANWAIWLCGRIIHYCFGPTERSWEAWSNLNQLMDTWELRKPQAFVPFFYKERSVQDKQYFPMMYFFDRIHVTGCQYFHIGRALLAIYDPRNNSMRVGLELQRAQRQLQKRVLSHVRELYGIAFTTSPDFGPALFTTCSTLPLFGPWVTDRNEQLILMNLMKTVERDHGWPTAWTQQLLIQEWGWLDT